MSLIGFTVLHMGALGLPDKKPQQRPSASRRVVCPECRATVGSSCTAPNGRRCRPHAARVTAAIAGSK